MINPSKDSRSWHGEKRRQDREHRSRNRRGRGGARGLQSRRGPRVAAQDPRRFAAFDDDEAEGSEEGSGIRMLPTKSLDELAEESLARSRSTRITLEGEQEWTQFVNMKCNKEEEEEDDDDDDESAIFDLDGLQKSVASLPLSERLYADSTEEKAIIEEFENEGKMSQTEGKGDVTSAQEPSTEPATTTTVVATSEKHVEPAIEPVQETPTAIPVSTEETEETNVDDDLIEDELDELLML